MPSLTLDSLAETYCRVSNVNAVALDQFHSFAMLLDRAHIPFLVLKGLDVLIRLYGIRGARPISDVDLLVHETDLPTLDRVLTDAGYRRQIDGNPCYAAPESGLSFDIVTTLWYLDEQGLAELWGNSRPYTIQTRTVALLAAEDLLIHLTAYALVHRGALIPAWRQDVQLLLLRERIDWEAITRKARQYSLTIPLFHGLTSLHRQIPTLPVSEPHLLKLAPVGFIDTGLYWLFQRLVTTQPIPEIGHFLLWLTRPTGQKWPWLRRTIMPPASFLESRYGTAATHTPLLIRCLRLASLAKAGFFLAAKIVRRLIASPMRGVT